MTEDEKKFIERIPAKLKELRERAGVTQAAAAKAAGVSRTIIASWETGVYIPQVKSLFKLSEIYKCDISEFFQR